MSIDQKRSNYQFRFFIIVSKYMVKVEYIMERHESAIRLISLASKSKGKFVEAYKKYDEENAERFYFDILGELKNKLLDKSKYDKIDFEKLSEIITYVHELTDQEKLQKYVSSANNPILRTNFVILASKYSKFDILQHLFINNGSALNKLTINPTFPNDTDEEGRNAFYYAIRSSNKEILNLLSQWPNGYFVSRRGELDEILSRAYQELNLKNVLLSDEIRIFVEKQLLDLRFFDNNNDSSSIQQLAKASSVINIKERAKLTIDNIQMLRAEYCDTEEIDGQFLYIAKFIAKNLHILKRQWKSTYNRLPWEELEFCLTCFIFANSKSDDLNLFYHTILERVKILNYLKDFGKKLDDEMNNLKSGNVKKLIELPKISRDKIIAQIKEDSPQFVGLYEDYERIRDIYSLKKINSYVEISLASNPRERNGQLNIMRALQVTGENMKNTLESPKLSNATTQLLLLSLQPGTRKIIINLRNSLSHANSFAIATEIEEDINAKIFVGIQSDIKHLNNVVTDILYKSKMITIEAILKQVVNCERFDQIEPIAKSLNKIKFPEVVMELSKNVNSDSDEPNKLGKLINELDNIIADKTKDEVKLFEEINSFLNTVRMETVNMKENYQIGLIQVYAIGYALCAMKMNANSFRGFMLSCNKALENCFSKTTSRDFKHFDFLTAKILNCIRTRAVNFTSNEKEYKLLLEIYVELRFMVEFGEDNSKWIVSMREQITKTTNLAGDKNTRTSIFKTEKYRKYLKDELARLKDVLNESNACNLSMNSEEHSAVVEALVLNVMSMLAKNRLTNNQLLLDEAIPVLMGKTLRNHLAHDNILVNVLHPYPAISLLVNAEKLSEADVINDKRKIGKLFREDISNLRKKHLVMSEILSNQKKLFVALERGDIDDLRSYIKRGADINGRAINLWTTLHFAAKGGNLDIVRLLLNHNLKADTLDDNGQNSLHIAALYGRTDIVEVFIKLGLDVNVRDHRLLTALHMAAKNGHSDVVRILLKAKADTTINDSRGHMPLHYAVENDYKDIVEILLHVDTNADINQTSAGLTALHIAAENGYVKLVDFLLQNGANVNARNDNQGISLHTTSLNGHIDVVKMLIAAGSEVNARFIDGSTALHYAVETGRIQVVDFLLENGAVVNVTDKRYFNTPLHLAAMNGHLEIVKSLLKYGANVNAVRRDGSIPLLLASMNGHLKIVTILVETCVNISTRNRNGLTSLHLAAQNGHASVVSYLITNKAQIECKSAEGITPLHVAAKFGHIEVVEALLDAGAGPNVPDHRGLSSLHMAAATDRVDIIQLLIESGAEVEVKTDMGLTPLHMASKEGQHKAASALINANSDVNSKTTDNMTPLFLAIVAGHKFIVEFLIKNGARLHVKDDETSLNLAIYSGKKEIVEILLANGANVNMERGDMPLCISIKNNRTDIANQLIKRGADVNAGNGEALRLAVTAGYKDMVDLLLKNKASINNRLSIAHYLHTLLHIAAFRNHTDILKLLIQYGANVNESSSGGITPLHLATENGNTAAVEILLANGAKVKSNSEGETPLHLAVGVRGNDEIFKMLLESGSDASIKDGKNRTPLELAVFYNHFLSVKILLQSGKANINTKPTDGFSLLHIAVQEGNTEIAKFLIDHGADINARNISGSKPIHIAVREGNIEAVEFFLSKGLTHLEDGGCCNQTLLYYAVITDNMDMVKFLISKGAKINAQDNSGRTPLHVGVWLNFEVVVKYLLDNGAIFNMVDNLNIPPLNFTKKDGMVNLLTSTGELFKAVKNKRVSDVERCISQGAAVNAKNTNDVTPLHLAICQGDENIVNILLLKGSNSNALAKGSTPLHYAAKFSHLRIVKALLSNEAIYNMATVNGETPLEFATQADIINLLKLVDESFQCVRNGNLKVIRNLKKIKKIDTIKAIMNACNRDKETLIVAAIRNRFPDVEKLKQLFQDNISADMELAEVFCVQERFDEGLKIYERILDSRIKLLGRNNPATLDVQYSIATIFYKQQKYTNALAYFEDIFEKRKAILGWESEDTLNTRNSIALVLHRLGKDEQAINMFEEIFQKQREMLGADHYDFQDTQLNMALSLDKLQRYDEALKMNYDVFEKRRNKLGKNHPATLVVQNNIAMVLNNQGKHEQALKIYRQVYESRKVVLGPSHSDTLRVLHNIAVVLSAQGKFEESITAFEDVLLTQKRLLGADHSDTIYTQLNIAGIYDRRGKHHSALKYFKVGIENGIKVLGTNHPLILESLETVKRIKLLLKLQGNDDLYVALDDLQKNMNIAISKGDKNAVEYFLNSGAEVNDCDSDGRTALHFAVDGGHMEIVKMLFAKGADATRTTNNGNTPLHIAALKGNKEIIEILLQNVNHYKLNGFMNARTRKAGITALHVAAKNCHFLIVKYLLQRGAIFNIRNNDGKSPVELAQSHANIQRLLQLVEELFRDAINGNFGIIDKLRKLKTASHDELLAVTRTRNCLESTIVQASLLSRNKSLASKILEMLKESF